MRVAVGILALLLLVASPAAAVDPTDAGPRGALVQAFVRALTREDSVELMALAGEGERGNLGALVDQLQGYECISVRGYRFAADGPETVHLQIDASARSRGAAHRELALPASWILEVDCGTDPCRLQRAETEERRAARLLVEAPPPDWTKLELCPELEPLRFAQELAEQFEAVGYQRNTIKTADVAPLSAALTLAREWGSRSAESAIWNRAASTAAVRGQSGLALEMARASVAAADASGDADAKAAARFRLGIVLWGAGDSTKNDALTDQGIRWLDEGATWTEALTDPRIGIKSLYMAGYVKRMRSRIREFLLDNERVIEWSHRYRFPGGAASASIAIGELHLSLREHALACDDFRSALRYANEASNPGLASIALGALGLAQSNAGDLDAAEEYFRRTERLPAAGGTAGIAMSLSMGGFLMRRGRLADAETRIVGAREAARHVLPAGLAVMAVTLLSELRLAQKRPAEALACAREALAEQPDLPVNNIDWSWSLPLWLEGKALRALGRPDEAVEALRAAVDMAEDQRRVAPADALGSALFFEGEVGPYVEMIDLLVERGGAAAAFDYAERMKGRALQDALARGGVDKPQSMLTPDQKEERARLAQRLTEMNKAAMKAWAGDPTELAAIRSQLEEARLALKRFETRMEIASPAARISPARARSTSDHLPSGLRDGALIEFVVGERRTVVFAVTRSAGGGVHVVARPVPITRQDLETRTKRFQRQIDDRDLHWTRSASALYDLLLAPVEGALAGRKLICVVPDGVLWQVPFPLLRHNGHDLVERAAVFYAPSLSMLQLSPVRAKSRSPRGELLAFGNPAVLGQTRDRIRALDRDAKLGDLPSAEKEVRAIASLYGGRQSRIYVRDAARESVFKRQVSHFRILHFAAHGILDDRSPMYSAIVLSAKPNETDDGLVEAREILDLRLGSDLAVLASCDTARGRLGAGEGVIGMSWAFLVAGCPTTVVSQWQVDSRATARLMIELHRHLKAGHTPAEALRRAQLRVRSSARYQDPIYWAPFIVVGAGMRSVL